MADDDSQFSDDDIVGQITALRQPSPEKSASDGWQDVDTWQDVPEATPQKAAADTGWQDVDGWQDVPTEPTEAQHPRAEGMAGSAAREFAHAALPAAASLPAIAAGAVVGQAVIPVPILGAATGAILAGAGATYLLDGIQDWVLKHLGFNDDAQRQANAEENPISSFVGGLAPNLAQFKVGAGQITRAQRLLGGALQSGVEAGQELYNEGTVSPTKLAIAGAMGTVFAVPRAGYPTKFLQAGEQLGQAGVDAVRGTKVSGRPDLWAPDGESDKAKADAATSVPPNTSRGTSEAKPPPPTNVDVGNPDSSAIRSVREYRKPGEARPATELEQLFDSGLDKAQQAALGNALENASAKPPTEAQVSAGEKAQNQPVPIKPDALVAAALDPAKLNPDPTPAPAAPRVEPLTAADQTSDTHPQLRKMRLLKGDDIGPEGVLSDDMTSFTLDARMPRSIDVGGKSIDPILPMSVRAIYTRAAEMTIRKGIEEKQIQPMSEQDIARAARVRSLPYEEAYLQEHHDFTPEQLNKYWEERGKLQPGATAPAEEVERAVGKPPAPFEGGEPDLSGAGSARGNRPEAEPPLSPRLAEREAKREPRVLEDLSQKEQPIGEYVPKPTRSKIVDDAIALLTERGYAKSAKLLADQQDPHQAGQEARHVLQQLTGRTNKSKTDLTGKAVDYATIRAPNKPAIVEGTNVTARSKADAERKGTALKAMRDSFEQHAPENEFVPVKPADVEALTARLTEAREKSIELNGGRGDPLAYRARDKSAAHMWHLAARKFLASEKTPKDVAKFIADEKQIRSSNPVDLAQVKGERAIEADTDKRVNQDSALVADTAENPEEGTLRTDAERAGETVTSEKPVTATVKDEPTKAIDWTNATEEDLDRLTADAEKITENIVQQKTPRAEDWKVNEDARAAAEKEKTAKLKAAREALGKEPKEGETKVVEMDNGMKVHMENPQGSVRKGKGPNGEDWEVKMPHDYGWIEGVKGGENEGLDVHLGPLASGDNPALKAASAYIIDQHTLTGKYDEPKVMYGFPDLKSAIDGYAASYSDGKGRDRVGAISTLNHDEFHQLLDKHRASKEAVGQQVTPEADPMPREVKDIWDLAKDEEGRLNTQRLNQSYRTFSGKLKNFFEEIFGNPASELASKTRDVGAQRASELRSGISQLHKLMDADLMYYLKRVSVKDGVSYIMAMEHAHPNDTAKFRAELTNRGIDPAHHDFMALRAPNDRALLDAAFDIEKAFGSQAEYRDNYMAHIFNDKKVNGQSAMQFLNTLGPTWFQHNRKFAFLEEAMKAGYELRYDNPVELITHRLMASKMMQANVSMLRRMQEFGGAFPMKEAPGYAQTGWYRVQAPDRQTWLLAPDTTNLWHNMVEARDMWQNNGRAGTLFRGWMQYKNAMVAVDLGLSGFHALHMANVALSANIGRALSEPSFLKAVAAMPKELKNSANDLLFSMPWEKATWLGGKGEGTGTYLGKTIREMMIKPENQLSPTERNFVLAAKEAGVSFEQPYQDQVRMRNAFMKAVRDDDNMAKLKTFLGYGFEKAMNASMGWLMKETIPNLKAASFARDMSQAFRRDPNLWNAPATKRRAVFGAIGRQADNRFGEMFYDALPWNPYVKNIGQSSFVSLGWNLSQVREFGGVPQELMVKHAGRTIGGREVNENSTQFYAHNATNKAQYLATYLASTMAVAGLMTYAMTGEAPGSGKDGNWMDFFFPRGGGHNVDGSARRLTTMFNTREIPMFISHSQESGNPVSGLAHMIWNKMVLSPITNAFQNRDFFGNELYDPTAAAPVRLAQFVDSTLGNSFNPIVVSGAKRTAEEGGGIGKQALSLMGFGPAAQYTQRTAMQNKIAHAFNTYSSGAATKPYEVGGSGLVQGVYRAVTDQPTQAEARRKARVGLNQATQAGDENAVVKARQAMIASGMSPKTVGRYQPGESDIYQFSRVPLAIQKQLVGDMTTDEFTKYVIHSRGMIGTAARVELIKARRTDTLPQR